MVGLLVIAVSVHVDKRLSDVLADGAVFMDVPGIYGYLPLVDCDY